MYVSKLARAVVASALFAVSAIAAAAPVPTEFVINDLSFIVGKGYGIGKNLLGVTFVANSAPAAFSLGYLEEQEFRFGRVTLNEVCIDGPKDDCTKKDSEGGSEMSNLDVTAQFNFASPISGKVQNIAVVGVTSGYVRDADVDFKIDFEPIQVTFGKFGLFEVTLSDAAFSKLSQGINLNATVTLLQEDIAPIAAVPEPGSLALLGLGLAGFAITRRRK